MSRYPTQFEGVISAHNEAMNKLSSDDWDNPLLLDERLL